MQWSANWIRPAKSYGDVCPAFRKTFFCPENVVSAALRITALGGLRGIAQRQPRG